MKRTDFREFLSCDDPACYSARFTLSNGEELTMNLCSSHLRNAVRLAEIEAARVFSGECATVVSMSFYHLALAEGRLRAS